MGDEVGRYMGAAIFLEQVANPYVNLYDCESIPARKIKPRDAPLVSTFVSPLNPPDVGRLIVFAITNKGGDCPK